MNDLALIALIIRAIDTDGYDIEKENLSEIEKVNFLINAFCSEYWHKEELYRQKTVSKVLKNWLQGLPSAIAWTNDYEEGRDSIPFYNYGILQMKEGKNPFFMKSETDFITLERFWDRLAESIVKLATFREIDVTIKGMNKRTLCVKAFRGSENTSWRLKDLILKE